MTAASGSLPSLGDRRGVAKRRRRQLAKSEALLQLAMKAQRWEEEILGTATGPAMLPFEQWPRDHPWHAMCRTYGLTPADVAGILHELADEMETRAIGAGYDDHWDELPEGGAP